MPKFGTFKFGRAKFGEEPPPTFRPEITYRRIPLGVQVRRQINKEIIYRVARGHQYKYPYFVPANPQTVPQQAWRTTFTNGVTAALALSSAEKETYREMAKRKPGQTWFSVFMSGYLWEESH